MKNYVINLKKRPERLYIWLGYQAAKGLDFSNLTICYGCDGRKEYPELELRKASELGIKISQDFVFQHISEDPDPESWHIVWLDDIVIKGAYHQYKHIEKEIESQPENACVVFLYKNDPHTVFHRGCGVDRCIALTPVGAEKMLALGQLYPEKSYEPVFTLLYDQEDVDLSGIYTASKMGYVDNNFVHQLQTDNGSYAKDLGLLSGIEIMRYENDTK